MIRGAIFDADGTLLDSMGIWETLGADYLRARGLQPRPGLAEALAPLSMEQAARYLRQEYSVTLTEAEIITGLNGMLERYYREEVQLKPGALGFLRQLRERGISMCIATATDRSLMEAALTRCGALEYFSRVFTCGEVGFGKDQPLIYRAALAHLGTKKQETLVFEDALHALATAKADGFPVVGVFDPWEPRQAEIKALADQYLTDYQTTPPDEILK